MTEVGGAGLKERDLKCLRTSRKPPATYLQKVGSDSLVRALLRHLLGQPGDFVRSLRNVLGTLDQGPFVPTAAPHQAGHLGHQQGHPLGCGNDVVTLQRSREGGHENSG